MALSAQWRKSDDADTILIVDDAALVRAACRADAAVLSRFLTDMGDLATWGSDAPVTDVGQLPESWGTLVCARAESGAVLTMDPELFWDGIYHWYRSRGVDYDTEALPA